MKLLHTSDWHIGRTLYGRKRYEEYEAFLTWLSETIQGNEIDVLLVTGDIFDTSAPSNRAQELYYRTFLTFFKGVSGDFTVRFWPMVNYYPFMVP
jgi:exonuclease SbcD